MRWKIGDDSTRDHTAGVCGEFRQAQGARVVRGSHRTYLGERPPRDGYSMADDQARAEINRLYWASDASVGEIADQLGVSRRALYDRIDPTPAGEPCPDCGSELGFRNRTAAERREASCAECGREQRLSGRTDSVAAESLEDPQVEQMARGALLSPMPARNVPPTASAVAVGGALLTGLAAGALIAYAVRRS